MLSRGRRGAVRESGGRGWRSFVAFVFSCLVVSHSFFVRRDFQFTDWGALQDCKT